ncbi:uncharacterized protein TM35_000053350 [Trypanosoma theileri]|uniref:Schlafen AlbA-2 domain-containing protein n=1 Tax=Trypanosoma theileri TaxID=67003 RepID=A0A1X0P5B4_9TRYP|nr:uncharacterized protein TM35_000053350 [Trypanosoma theileri]ORC91739.1 hypothetical protein TM35_000053350 [Trypanosoma theileri]
MVHGDIHDLHTISTELTLATLIANAANTCDGSDTSVIQLRVLSGPVAVEKTWSRRERDEFLLCLDRSVARVYPPLDPLQYTQTPPELLVMEDHVRMARVHITPTIRFCPDLSSPHGVEGDGKISSNTLKVVEEEEGEEEERNEDETTQKRRRWKKAAWLTARVFNESSWHLVERIPSKGREQHKGENNNNNNNKVKNNYKKEKNVIDMAIHQEKKRILHVDVHGMEIIGRVVALSSQYAYIAVPYIQDEQTKPKWVFVSRVGIPSVLASAAETTRKRIRSDSLDDHTEEFLNEKELTAHEVDSLRYLQSNQRVQVTLRTHKVYCKRYGAATVKPEHLSLTFEDATVLNVLNNVSESVIEQNKTESLTTFTDILYIVRESCARFLRGYNKYLTSSSTGGGGGVSGNGGGGSSSSSSMTAEDRLFTMLTDTVSVHVKKARGKDGRPPVTVSSPQEIPMLVEGTCVEFKAKINKWEEETDDTLHKGDINGSMESQRKARMGLMNLERIRNTIAAMASTLGGVVLIGVTDDGKVIGHTREALRELRLTGFCPAMVKDNVKLTEMRALMGNRPTSMPKDWWKKKQPSQIQSQKEQEEEKKEEEKVDADRVITIITVGRGQAPFYSTSRHSVPYMRGFASTVPMPVVVCARRIANLLP